MVLKDKQTKYSFEETVGLSIKCSNKQINKKNHTSG